MQTETNWVGGQTWLLEHILCVNHRDEKRHDQNSMEGTMYANVFCWRSQVGKHVALQQRAFLRPFLEVTSRSFFSNDLVHYNLFITVKWGPENQGGNLLVLHITLEILQCLVSKSKVQPLVRILSTMFEVIKSVRSTLLSTLLNTLWKSPFIFQILPLKSISIF